MKFYFDEDSAQHRLVAALRSYAIDVVTFLDAGMNARDDESHLQLAAAQGPDIKSAPTPATSLRCIVNGLEQGRSHFGVLIVPQQRYSTGEIVRRILRLTSSRFDMADGLYYLSNF